MLFFFCTINSVPDIFDQPSYESNMLVQSSPIPCKEVQKLNVRVFIKIMKTLMLFSYLDPLFEQRRTSENIS
jgi:hypothetical protein